MEKVPAVAEKVLDKLPALTVTAAGTCKAALLLLRATAAPPVGAAFDKVMVHVLAAEELRLVGAHASEATVTGATRDTDADAEVAL